jgi:branched-chain amino acid transport system ATP-binding protein
MLAIGRALMSKPKILLLDEPSLGLAPTIVEKIYEHIEQLKKNTNLTILLVEQHAMKALSIADRVYFLRLGEIVSSGKASDLKEKTDFKKIYFGE